MAKQNLNYATVTNTLSIRMDGASVDRIVSEQSAWLSDRLIMRLFAILFAVGLAGRVLSGVNRDLSATYRHYRITINNLPQWWPLYFVWRAFYAIP